MVNFAFSRIIYKCILFSVRHRVPSIILDFSASTLRQETYKKQWVLKTTDFLDSSFNGNQR
jgi:hypothetical protein